MIQFNMLPQVKVDYIRTKRLKRTIMGFSLIAVALSIALLILTFSLKAFQNTHLKHLDSNIANLKTELSAVPDLTKIISVQNQLNTLPGLYETRPAVERLPGYLNQTTPTNVGLIKVGVDFSANTVTIDGSADSLESVNRYVDTLKFTKYSSGEGSTPTEAFKDIVLSNFARDEKAATFSINMAFDPLIFNGTKEVTLVIPSIITTRSQVQSQTGAFNTGAN